MHAGNAYGITLTLPGEGNTNTALPWIIAAGKPGIQTTNGQWVTIFALGGTNYTINTLMGTHYDMNGNSIENFKK